MTKLVVCGQAPSRVGDGRAFSGPSGKRLAKLFRLEDYEELASKVTLTNIFEVPAETKILACRRRSAKRRAPGDQFDMDTAIVSGFAKMLDWAADPEHVVVLAMGHNVCQALLGQKLDFYQGKAYVGKPVQGVDVWCFPHPSGASQYWNNPDNTKRARRFIRKLLKHYSIDLA